MGSTSQRLKLELMDGGANKKKRLTLVLALAVLLTKFKVASTRYELTATAEAIM